MNMKPISVLLLSIILLGCSKSGSENNDRENPVVQLASPSDGQVFNSAQTIRISGTVTDNKYLKEIHIEVSSLDTGEEYLHVHIHPAAASYAFDQSYTLAAGTSYKIRVIADDASSNSSAAIVNIRCN
jgi:hypothetical protein